MNREEELEQLFKDAMKNFNFLLMIPTINDFKSTVCRIGKEKNINIGGISKESENFYHKFMGEDI